MKRLHILGLTCFCLGIAAMLLFRANSHAIAATPSSCGAWNVVASPNNGYSSLSGIATITANNIWAAGTSHPSNKIYSKTLIEHWDGTSWSIVPSPNVPAVSNALYGITAVSATDIWAVGTAQKYGMSLIEHWNGTTWRLVAGPTLRGSAFLNSVAAVSATDIWAVGSGYGGHQGGTLVEHWNGTKWSIVPDAGPVEATLYGVSAISATDIWAVGNDGASSTLIEHWDGTSWSDVKSPQLSYYNYLNGVAAVSATDIWAVGEIVNSSGKALVENWNGTQWSVVPSAPAKGATLFAVGAVSATDIWAVGLAPTSNSNIAATLTEHWNGTSWSIVRSPNPGNLPNSFNAVASVPGSNYVWAVGTTNYSGATLTAYYC
jgi:hypothetical protein